MSDLSIGLATARRFILGRQGVWPGRRWQGLVGTAQALAFMGLNRARTFVNSFAGFVERRVSLDEAQRRLNKMVDKSEVAPLQVEGWKEPLYALTEDVPALLTLEAGGVPAAWQPLDTTTKEETVFLAPLDIVSARGRAKLKTQFM